MMMMINAPVAAVIVVTKKRCHGFSSHIISKRITSKRIASEKVKK